MRLLTSPLIYLARHILTKQFALLSDRMTTFQQAQVEGLCLRFPNNLGIHREVNYEHAVEMLIRAVPTSQNTPFVWGFIDKPAGPSRAFDFNCNLNLIPTHISQMARFYSCFYRHKRHFRMTASATRMQRLNTPCRLEPPVWVGSIQPFEKWPLAFLICAIRSSRYTKQSAVLFQVHRIKTHRVSGDDTVLSKADTLN